MDVQLGDDRSNPHALLVLGVLATRNGDCDTATSVVKRPLRPPNIGGLSAAWAVTEWAERLRDELGIGSESTNRFLDNTRELAIDELGRLH